ncbi:uncharacterized protein LOC111340580 isoform X2 [Stylophora pistillata]|uniref:uncharacterized protein LOC111340580 isoform X2 n=1 Tax=Stylophora pistillata TaxID=50429 RepID=UPI000C046C4D|nr:uncharacterized protein LOC111340580 isoform X2 [Stylophora pistillata]
MTRYDRQGVPNQSFHNPKGITLYPEGLDKYAMGNTPARDITELLGTSAEQHVDVLLLACGDVRNFLCSISDLSLRNLHEHPKSLSFHLNDYDPSVIARDVVLLEVASVINSDVPADVEFLWNIWYNLALSSAHFDRLRKVLSELLERNFDTDEIILKFQDGDVLQECRDIWKDWMDLDLEVKSVKEERNNLMEDKTRNVGFCEDSHRQSVLDHINMEIYQEELEKFVKHAATNPLYTEIEHWYREGSTSDESEKTNPTLIRPFVRKWRQHYSSCAFKGYPPLERRDLEQGKSCADVCKEKLAVWVKRFQEQSKNDQATLKVTLWTGDALALCTSGFLPEMLFDVIDTSNLSDHAGLLNVLVCCAPRLKVPNESLLFTSSMLWHGKCDTIKEYYQNSVGVPSQLLPTVLGLKLAVDLELGSKKLPDDLDSTEETLCWVKADTKRTLLTIDKATDVVQALLDLTERCFNLSNETSIDLTLPSPLTLLRIIHQAQPLFKGGATKIFHALENKLPADFKERHGLSWNLLKASLGRKPKPIVEIKVTTKLTVQPSFKGTPKPVIYIEREHSSPEDDPLQWILAIDLASQPNPSAIHNSLRYEDKTHVATFHLSEEDWNELNCSSTLRISSREAVIDHKPVRLGDETVKSVKRVDPVETFGLFASQTFTVVESDEKCQVVKVIKMEEEAGSYSGELEILDSAICKAEAIEISQPDKSPTDVQIDFRGATGDPLSMYFSCFVDIGSSEFQISRKVGKIFCNISKLNDGTVGELVIQNLAPLPFHAMPEWDSSLTDIRMLGRMFRTMHDVKLKSQRMPGPPFFDLRESISDIIDKHVTEPEIPRIHYVDERGIIEEPYDSPEDMLKKKGFVIKEKVLFRKMLYTHAARVPQDRYSVVWKNSYITPLFPRERTLSLLCKAVKN